MHRVRTVRLGKIKYAAIVLCGSSSDAIAVSLIIKCASSTSRRNIASGFSPVGLKRSNVCCAVSITWLEAVRPPLLPPIPSATMPSTQPTTRGWARIAT
ncbi:hypothetical protein [Vitreoscilla filiformis]|uniref:hypothetical protein n=1 Tax=Vitreoscilla filiformis TaxID=63 RepID=UPI0018DFAD18|nr:hypothetical protein [Vitreoscilla filiformis]